MYLFLPDAVMESLVSRGLGTLCTCQEATWPETKRVFFCYKVYHVRVEETECS